MKQIISTIIFILVCTSFASAQSIDKITRRCPSPNGTVFGSVSVINSIIFTPCPNQSSFFNGQIKMLDNSYNGVYLPNVNYLRFGTNTRYTIPQANHFVASEYNYPLTISGTNKVYAGSRTYLDIQGTVTNPSIYGNLTQIFSNSTFPANTGTVTGVQGSVDVGGPFSEAYGGRFHALAGSSGANGLGTIIGLQGAVAPAHNGSTNLAIAGDFWMATGVSDPVTVNLAIGVRSQARFNAGVTLTTFRGISVSDWLPLGGAVTNSTGIYIDNSIDVGTAQRWAIDSASVSPSRLAGDVYISNSARGIILKSPDGNCWRYTAANGGALNAGVSVTCPA